MEHREFKKFVNGARSAVLFIHGIVGTPNHFCAFLPAVSDSVSLYNLLLDGHGGSAKAFSASSMTKWVTQVTAAVDELSAQHERIYIVAHSMGSLFAIEQAIRCQKVVGLFLLAVPIQLRLRPAMFRNALKVYRGNIRPDDRIALAARDCYGIQEDKNLLHYFGWVPRYLELFKKIRSTRRILPFLSTPCSAYQSMKDEMVSTASIQYLKCHSSMNVEALEGSGHYYYSDEDMCRLLEDFRVFLV